MGRALPSVPGCSADGYPLAPPRPRPRPRPTHDRLRHDHHRHDHHDQLRQKKPPRLNSRAKAPAVATSRRAREKLTAALMIGAGKAGGRFGHPRLVLEPAIFGVMTADFTRITVRVWEGVGAVAMVAWTNIARPAVCLAALAAGLTSC